MPPKAPPKSFIDTAVERLCQAYDLTQGPSPTLLVPTPQAGDLLLRRLGEKLPKEIWAPLCYTPSACWQALSPRYRPDELTLLDRLYQVALAQGFTTASFAAFAPKGRALCTAFSTLDHLLLSPEAFFSCAPGEAEGKGAPPRDPAAIAAFWKRLPKGDPGSLVAAFRESWKRMPALYQGYQACLSQAELATSGGQVRHLLKSFQQGLLPLPPGPFLGIGLPTLTPAEQALVSHLITRQGGACYWDIDPYYLKEPYEAGAFFRRLAPHPDLGPEIRVQRPEQLAQARPCVTLHGLSSPAGEVRLTCQALARCWAEPSQRPPAQAIALVLSDPSLCVPLMAAWPAKLPPPHFPQGLPLTATRLYPWLLHLLYFLQARSLARPEEGTHLQALLNHPFTAPATPLSQAQIRIALAQGTLPQEERLVWPLLLGQQRQGERLWPKLNRLLNALRDDKQTPLNTLERAAIQQVQELLTRWATLPSSAQCTALSSALLRELTQQLHKLSVRWEAPEEHIAVLSLRQTLARDYTHLFLVSAHEGHLPPAPSPPGPLPAALLQAWGWPSSSEVEAYAFFRLITRVQYLHITYQQANGRHGPLSRWVKQLLYEHPMPIDHHPVEEPLNLHPIAPLSIPKQGHVQAQLATFCAPSGEEPAASPRLLTPSALNTYLTCPLQFYFRHVARLRPPKEEPAFIAPYQFGELLHEVLALFYSPCQDKLLSAARLQKRLSILPALVQEVMARQLGKGWEVRGDYQVAHDLLVRLLDRLIAQDKALAPLTIRAVEKVFQRPFSFAPGRELLLGGVIDRVDQRGEQVVVLDYKTGVVEHRIGSIEQLFRPDNRKGAAALQVLWYAWLYAGQGGGQKITPQLRTIRRVLSSAQGQGDGLRLGRQATPIEDITPLETELLGELKQVCQAIWEDPAPFQATPDKSRCLTCDYRKICQRGV